MYTIKNAYILLLLVLLIGCSSSPEKPEEKAVFIDTKIAVSLQVNPDINNRPSPIVVRIYELKNLGKYAESGFYDLFDNYQSVFGSELVSTEQLNLKPGDTQTLNKKIAPETQYIAVIAAYRNLDRAMWKDVLFLPADQTKQLMIFVDKLNISIWKK